LYTSQVATLRDSPIHRDALLLDLLRGMRVSEVMRQGPTPVCFRKQTPAAQILQQVGNSADQDVFPVLDEDERAIGLVTAATLRVISLEFADTGWTLAADLMQPVVSVLLDDDLRTATERMVQNGLRELPILDGAGRVLGLLNESAVAEVYLKAALRAESADKAGPSSARR
jgi:chloride channel protein, CIC family